MEKLKSKKWWIDVGTRVLKTFAQSALGAIGTTAVLLTEVNWLVVASTAGLSAVCAFLWNFALLPDPDEETEQEVE